jgi:hypothetical protein
MKTNPATYVYSVLGGKKRVRYYVFEKYLENYLPDFHYLNGFMPNLFTGGLGAILGCNATL